MSAIFAFCAEFIRPMVAFGTIIFSCKIINGKTTIYANRIFNNCSEVIAGAVIELYVNDNENAQNIIIRFIEQFDPGYKIKSKIQNKDEKEMIIKKITINHPNNDKEKLENQMICVTDDDFIDLDIIVENS